MVLRPSTAPDDFDSSLDALRTPHGLRPIRRLGKGGFGVVFEVEREGGQRLALKRLTRIDAESIYRFKQEFRVLAGRRHENLVRLHELYADGSVWAFTMDLVHGVPFDVWVRGHELPESHTANTQSTQGSGGSGVTRSWAAREQDSDAQPTAPRIAMESEALVRLRRAFSQLVRGVLALHEDGVLHRDLKPTNVLVDATGRVTILDFGLALVSQGPDAEQGSRAGTPAYMSPEQARGASLTMASDWYAVGVMLYEALVGHPPFAGTTADVLAAKRTRDPRDPRHLQEGLPDDLCDLACSLLSRVPSERPSGFTIARTLGLSTSVAASPRHVLEGTFVGREAHLRALQHAYDVMRSGHPVVAHVHGRSGLGKTTLVRHFVADLSLRGEVVVLEGRCFERESVPFKAVDDLVDALGRYLAQLKPLEAAGFMPRDAQALIRLFPSLGRLDFLTSVSGRAPEGDAFEIRNRAFSAFRELLTRISDTRPVVLVLEDVHWGDRDSAELIRHLLAPPDVPPLLLIASARPETSHHSEMLRILCHPQAMDSAWTLVDVEMGPFEQNEAELLAERLLSSARALGFSPGQIANEASRSPLLIAELVRAATRADEPGPVSMKDVVALRRKRLDRATSEVLEVLSLSDRPLPAAALALVLERSEEAVAHQLDCLCDEHLTSVVLLRGKTEYEVFHDRIRWTVAQSLDDDTKVRMHSLLAEALKSIEADPEMIFAHFVASGRKREAAEFAERAGDRAFDGTAFEQATALYRSANDRLHEQSPEHERTLRKLARASAEAGHCEDAARVYQIMIEREVADAAHLKRLAGEQFLRAGLIREGLRTLEEALNEAGLSPPKTPGMALTALLYRRARLRWRGLGLRPQVPVSPRDAHVMDLCWALGNGLTGIDMIRSVHYHAQGLWLALESTDPRRVARSLALNAALSALESRQSADAAESTLRHAERLADDCQDAHAKGWALAGRALQAWTRTELPACIDYCEQAVAQLRVHGNETFREIGSIEVWFHLHSLFLTGRLDEVAERAPACAREAELRGDRYTNSTVRAYVLPLLWAARGELDEARRDAERALEMWPADSWYHQHWAHLRAQCFLDLYENKGERILGRTAEARPKMKAAMHLRLRTPRLELNYLEGRGALEELRSARDGKGQKRLRKLVEDRIARLEEEQSHLATAFALALRAGLRSHLSPSDALAAWEELCRHCSEQGLLLHEALTRVRLQQLRQPSPLEQDDEALRAVRKLGVVFPLPFADMLLPRLTSLSTPHSS